MRAKVYWNLHKKLFSVQVSGRVVAHATHVILENVRLTVSKAGQARVRREKRKNVHAYLVGDVIDQELYTDERVTYNPHRDDTFVDVDTGKPLEKAKYVRCEVQNGRPIVHYYGAGWNY